MVEQWSSKSHTWVRFLLLLSIENLFRKKSKNFASPSIFFKTVNFKVRKPYTFLISKTNKFFIKANSFIFNKALTKWFFWKNSTTTSSYIEFFFINLKKKKYFCKNVLFSHKFLPTIDQSQKFYNFFLINNFLFNNTFINFFKIINFKKINKFHSKLFFKIKKTTSCDFLTKKKSKFESFFTKNFFKNFSFNYLTAKFSLKRLRNATQQNLCLIFSISKNVFNNKSSLNHYFKKCQTLAFQLDRQETLSTKLFKISQMSKKLDKFQFIIPKKINFFKKQNHSVLINTLYTLNMSNQLNNFFYIKFYSQKINNSNYLNFNKNSRVIIKFFQSSQFSLKKFAHTKFLVALASFLSKINPSSVKKKRLTSVFKNKIDFNQYNDFFSKFNILNFLSFFAKPFFFKSIVCNRISDFYKNLFNFSKYFFKKQYQIFFFNNQKFLKNNNLVPSSSFFYIYKKKILKLFQYDKFPLSTTPFWINSIIRFFEHCSGKSVIFKTNLYLNRALSYYEKSQCFNWSLKIKIFRKMLGPRLFLAESLEILYLTFKLKDPFFLSNWLLGMMKKISFWKYRLFFRYLKYVLRFFFVPAFKELNVKGIKFQLKGKISVAGNARTRTLLQKTGVTGHASFNNKVVSELSLVPSFTGVMGLKVWIFF